MSLVLMKNVVLVAHAAMTVAVPVLVLTVLHLAAHVAPLWVATWRLRMAATNLLRPLGLMQTNPPFSASAR
ncbi:MAG: hypothetical protein ACJA2P_001240 [Rhodoferax sp.]